MNALWIAAILGIVLGLTEYLPVSSAGHLILAGTLLDFTGPKATCFEVFLQIGAISAVVVLYWPRFVRLIPFRRNAEDGNFSGLRGLSLLALTTVPAVICGAFAHHFIKQYLFGPLTVAAALGVGGIGILLAERYKPESQVEQIDSVSYGHALKIGLFQCLALWPGMSRSASTIVGGLFCGLDRRIAAEYSFLAAVPILSAAAIFDLYKNWSLFHASDIPMFAVGIIVSFLSASIAVKTFIALLQRWNLVPYAFYRIAIAPIIFLAMLKS
ncbi:MAG: undecaprenyl-diphosphate phosphatase [Desulfomonilaceae bacterium]